MKFKILLLLVIFLGFILRIWHIDKFPATLYGDEQAFAWNAYNILKLGQDEYGNAYPLQFRSFDDYKAPVPVYLLVPFIKFLGLNAFAIRLPIALASTFTVIAVYLLARVFFTKKVSLVVAYLLSVSPWHIHLSRGFFESTLALLWFILGVYFFVKDKPKLRWIFLSMLFFGLSIYSYFTPRILIPIFLLFLFYYQKAHIFSQGKIIFGNLRTYILGLFFLFFLSVPLVYLTFFSGGFSRFNKLTESNDNTVIKTVNIERSATGLSQRWSQVFHNKATVWMRLIKNNYLEHLSINFWYLYGDNSLRYFTGNMGMFYLLEFPFLVIGSYYLWREKRRVAVFSIGWILLSAIPASLVGRPFAVRSISLLPAPFFIVGYGLYKVSDFFVRKKLRTLFPVIIAFLFTVSIGSLLIRYYLEYPVFAATWWGWENKAAIDYAKKEQANYSNVFISDYYTGATLAYAVYTQYDPLAYRYALNHPVTLADGRSLIKLGKYYFGSLDLDTKRLSAGIIPPRSLYIGRPQEADSDETINAPDDGRIIFKIYKTK